MEKPDPNMNKVKEVRRRVTIETLVWLIIIACLLIITLQATGVVNSFTLQSEWVIASLIAVGAGLLVSAIYQFFINSRLKASIRKLMEQQMKNKASITLVSSEAGDGEQLEDSEEDQMWKEQVRFTAVIEERQRLARELHDAVSQQLFAISMTATAVSRTIERDWEKARAQVQLIEEMASVAQSEMRALLLHLRPVHLDGKSVGQALTSLIQELQQKIPMNIDTDIDTTIVMQQDAEDHLFRIAQEALSNTLRHSKAENMKIQLYRKGNEVHMLLADDGVGFNQSSRKQGSYGLLTMEERVRELGGLFRLMSEPDEGTTIYIVIPAEVTTT